MAKVKNKRNSGLADKVHQKRKTDAIKKKINPFEVHINKEKIKVLGKKSKHDRGLPGVARAKAIQKRKETLGTEMKLMNKTNTFIDRRIGEKNNQLSAEDKMIARFAAERARLSSKQNIYNLADDEILTHRGQTLEQIEKFDDPRSDEEEEDGKQFGGLDNDFVSEGHFGGGMLSKSESKDGAKSHKDLIEQLIAESKKRKAEKQKEKEQTLDLTEKLDSEWKDLQPVVFKRPKVEEKKEESIIDKLLDKAEKKNADYDKMMRELRFEKRGTPSDGLKNDEKQAREEKEKLAQLEKERELRMMGEEVAVTKNVPNKKHRSADDLEENFELEDEKEFMLAYDKDGKPLVPDHILKANIVPNAKPKFEDGVSDTSSDEDEANEESDEKEEEEDLVPLDEIKIKDSEEADIKTNGEVNSELIQDSENDENEEDEKDNEGSDEESEGNEEDSEEEDDNSEESKDDLNDLKAESESDDDINVAEDNEKISSFFTENISEGDNLKELLTGKTPAQQSAAIQKLIKSYDPGLAESNKENLSRLFAHLLRYVHDVFKDLKDEGEILKSFLIFDKIAPYFYDLAQTNKVSTKKYIVELLKEKHNKFMKNPRKVPDLDTLIFFKLVSLIYPTSDFRHPVTTPSLVFMSEILNLSRFNSAYSISRGLFITAIILEYTVLSKRFVPEAINFLRGILYLSANTSILNPIEVVPPFKLHKDAKILKLEDDCSCIGIENKMAAKHLVLNEIDNDFKIRCLFSTTLMLKEFFSNYIEFEALESIFEPHIKLLDKVDLDFYPRKVVNIIKEIQHYMKSTLEVKTFTLMTDEKKKPKALRLYEPDIQKVFTGSKSSKLPREMAERERLKHKIKKEMKGALREIRRDKAYIASVKIRQKIKSDAIRKDKVKQIFKDASIQQGELNKLKRMK